MPPRLAVPLAAALALATPSQAQIEPCKLLTAQQVSTVLPDHDKGSVAHAGPALIKGVNAYQCSYMSPAYDLFTVILNVAVDSARFAEIKPSASRMRSGRPVAAGDGGFIRGGDTEMRLTVLKGRTVIDLNLSIAGADAKADALIALARAIVAKLP